MLNFSRRGVSRIALTLSLALSAGIANAQTYPDKPVTMIIPFAAGGPTDVVARIVGEHMGRTLGQSVVIENVTGAGGTTGVGRAATAQPDGYTIVIGHTGTHAAAVALNPGLKYDPVASFAHIGLVNTNPILVVSRKSLPTNNLAEFVTWLKANQATANNAHAGIGSVSHTTCLLFKATLGIKTTEVPYRGTGPAMNDIVGGQVDFLCDQIVNVAPQVTAGTIKAYAVAQSARAAALPNVPTTVEAGLPQYQVTVWNGMFAPKGTPAPIVDKLTKALSAALDDPTVKKRLEDLGAEMPTAAQRTPDGLAAFVRSEIDRWTPVIKAAGVTMSN